MSKPLKVGITGGIGAGKSTVSRIFSALGIPVYDADKRGRILTDSLPGIKEKIIREFGVDAYKEGLLDRPYIAGKVFNNPDRLALLNNIIHPEVDRDFNAWCGEQENNPYILKEAALLVESGSYRDLDKLIMVTAPVDTRVERVLKRDPFRSEQQIREIIKRQISDIEKEKMADFIIRNDNTSPVIPAVLSIHEEILKQCTDHRG